MTEPTEKWQDVILKLLAKAENSVTNETERESIMDKVTYLMSKFGIEQAMLDAKNNRVYAVVRREYKVGNPYKLNRQKLLASIVNAFGCRAVRMIDDITFVVFGHEDDQEKVFMLYISLVTQMIMGVNTAEKPTGVHGKTFNTSWVTGFTYAVCDRICDSITRARKDVKNSSTGSGMDLVLRDRSIAVADEVNKEFPHLSYGRGRSSSANSSSGYSAGRSAGQRADIGQSRIGGRRAIGS